MGANVLSLLRSSLWTVEGCDNEMWFGGIDAQ